VLRHVALQVVNGFHLRRAPPSKTAPGSPEQTVSVPPECPGSSIISTMPSSIASRKDSPSDLAIPSLADVVEALGLEHAAGQFVAAAQRAIARNEAPTALLDALMHDQLRAHIEERAKAALPRSGISLLTTSHYFDHPKLIAAVEPGSWLLPRFASTHFLRRAGNRSIA
jgi:hypothetical protein